jgi:cobalamin biosynthesis Mg chelatase CobN
VSPKSSTAAKPQKVTRDDIESKLRELRGEVDERVEEVKVPAIAIAVGVAVVTVVAAYWFGKRRGKKRQMVLEIRRL